MSSLQLPVRKMRFSPDGRDLVVLCEDERAVRILHLSTLASVFEELGIPPIADHTRGLKALRAVIQQEACAEEYKNGHNLTVPLQSG